MQELVKLLRLNWFKIVGKNLKSQENVKLLQLQCCVGFTVLGSKLISKPAVKTVAVLCRLHCGWTVSQFPNLL